MNSKRGEPFLEMFDEQDSSLDLFKTLLHTSPDGLLIETFSPGVEVLGNRSFLTLFDLDKTEIFGSEALPIFAHIAPTFLDPELARDLFHSLASSLENCRSETFWLKDGRILSCELNILQTSERTLGRVWRFREITALERIRALERNRVHSMTKIAMGAPLSEILESIARGVEIIRPGIICTVLAMDATRKAIDLAVSPTLSTEITSILVGMSVADLEGSCRHAFTQHTRCIVADLDHLEKSERYAAFVKLTGAKSAWSEPILDSEGEAIGTFSLLLRSPCLPNAEDESAMRDAAELAAVAIMRRRTDEVIKSQELRFRTVFEGSNDAILLSVKEGVLDCNQRAWQLFELSNKDDMMGSRMLDFWPEFQPNGEGSTDYAKRLTQEVIEKGSIQFDWMHKTKNGRIFPTDVVVRTYIADGRRFFQFTIRDISERYAAQQAIDLQREKLVAAAKMSSLGEMAGGIAHEINNPLMIIIGHALRLRKRIEREAIDLSQLTTELLKIEATAHRIGKIVKGLRTFSRNAEGDPFERTHIGQIIEDTLELCQEKIKHHAIVLEVSPNIDASILCRPAQISQVLLNLISNATDAIEKMPDAWIRIETKVDLFDGQLAVFVTDSGTGIEERLLDKLMQPFFTTKEVGKGTGLGLSISRGITEDHGGTLTYDRQSPNTRFILKLPLAPEEKIPPQAS